MARREFMKKAGAGLLAAGSLPGPSLCPDGQAAAKPLDGRRILTFNSVIRFDILGRRRSTMP